MMPMRETTDMYRVRPARVSWKMPLFMNNDWVALRILQICDEIGVDRPFDIVYGAPMCAWAGGRPSQIRETLTRRQLERYFEAYADFGVRVALTMSRLEISEDSLTDDYCNRILDVADHYGAQVILVDDKLVEHVRRTHPDLTLIASLNKCMCELRHDYSVEHEFYRKLLTRFDEVVVRCECALDDDSIGRLRDVADRIEIITNQACMPNCQFCYQHISNMESFNTPGHHAGESHACYYLADGKDLGKRLTSSLAVSETRICKLVGEGFYKLKLAGRNADIPRLLDNIGMYVFEPNGAFRDIRNEIMREYKAVAQRQGFLPAPYELPRASDFTLTRGAYDNTHPAKPLGSDDDPRAPRGPLGQGLGMGQGMPGVSSMPGVPSIPGGLGLAGVGARHGANRPTTNFFGI